MLRKLIDSSEFRIVMRHLPTLSLIFVIALSLFYGRNLSFQDLLELKPKGLIAAAIFFLIIYAVKSLSFLVPILVIYAAVGTLFPLPLALFINISGAAIVVTIPYWLGNLYGAGFMGTLFSKFPKIEGFINARVSNAWLVSSLPRTIFFAPLKTVSVYLGSIKIPYFKYLLGSLAGLLPMLASVTIIGSNIAEPSSPEFIVAVIIVVISAWCSIAFYFLGEKRRERKGK